MTTSKSWALVVAGYSILAVAMLAFLTVNGISATTVETVATASLIGLGLLIPAAGMLWVARRMEHPRGAAGRGLVLQSISLIGLLIGLVVSFVASSLPSFLVAAVFIVLSGTSGLVGATFLAKGAGAPQLIVGTALIAIGAVLIPVSNIAATYWISDVEKDVYQDIGATLAGCGCILAAYSVFILRSRGRRLGLSMYIR